MEMTKMQTTNIYNLFIPTTCLGPSAPTAQMHSDASTKTQSYAFGVFTDLAQMEIRHQPAIRRRGLREVFGNTTPCIALNPEVFKTILLRWVTIHM